jgi:hypothetical protein
VVSHIGLGSVELIIFCHAAHLTQFFPLNYGLDVTVASVKYLPCKMNLIFSNLRSETCLEPVITGISRAVH